MDLKVDDISLTCDTSLKVFNNEFNRMSKMDDDLFTYEVEVANIPCDSNIDDDSKQQMLHEADDDTGYDPSDVAFTEWLGLNFFNYKTMDQYTKKALWIYWIRGDNEVEITDEEFSDSEDDVAEVFRIDTNIFNFETPMCKAFNEFNYLLNSLRYQDLKWYKDLEDNELKEQALRNKAIMEGSISDDESSNDGWRRWESHEITYHDHDEIKYKNETHDERQELCEAHELLVCNIRKFQMIKYSFRQDEEYVAVKEDECDNLARTNNDACRAYQEIFRRMDGPRERNINEYWWRIYKHGDLEVLES
uniref:C2 calcium/lipid-binding domain, CaLB n=1 Tax=Tanacetum cinerariifolium TaxID=118510 RepID=A0A6L2JI36_TANCI|nr:C2 calcium/lipid-binding domain, CaLB [Tanacetum cinerariifolium]